MEAPTIVTDEDIHTGASEKGSEKVKVSCRWRTCHNDGDFNAQGGLNELSGDATLN
jgi:hypothetical protein